MKPSVRPFLFSSLLGVLSWLPAGISAQEVKDVHATYTYIVGENDNITLREAKRKCIELAKAEGIKDAFGELVTSDVIDSNSETNGEASSSYFWENTVAMAKGDWLSDTQPPVIDVSYTDGKLIFKAEVWGQAREIIQAATDLKWKIMKNADGDAVETSTFQAGERILVSFRSPADGYVAVYLITGDDETACLLPYRNNATGKVQIKHDQDYTFFDKEVDPEATHYKLNTKRESEDNQLVIIYSPNPFTKCNDITGDKRHPNSLSTHDFQKWLLKCQRADRDMIINKKWIKINNPVNSDN